MAPTAVRSALVRSPPAVVVRLRDSTGRERRRVRKQLVVWYERMRADRLPERVEPWRTRSPIYGGILIRSQGSLGLLRRGRHPALQLEDRQAPVS